VQGAAAWALSGVIPRASTCTANTGTILTTDRSGYISESDASACAVTLPQAGTAGFANNFMFAICDIGAGTSTITPTTSTISYTNGTAYTSAASSLPLTTGQCAAVYSDNANYFAIQFAALSFPDLTDTAGTILTATVPLSWSAGIAHSGNNPQFFRKSTSGICMAGQGDVCDVLQDDTFGIKLAGTALLGWSTVTGDASGSLRTSIGSINPGIVNIGSSSNANDIQGTIRASTVGVPDNGNTTTGNISFGSQLTFTSAACETAYAPTTLATGATTTDTGLNCLPANAVIDTVVARVTTTITAACTGWSLGDATTAGRFSSNNTVLTSGTVTDAAHIGTFNNTGIASATTGTWQASAAKVRITCAGGNPGAGAIRVIVFYHTWTAPTS